MKNTRPELEDLARVTGSRRKSNECWSKQSSKSVGSTVIPRRRNSPLGSTNCHWLLAWIFIQLWLCSCGSRSHEGSAAKIAKSDACLRSTRAWCCLQPMEPTSSRWEMAFNGKYLRMRPQDGLRLRGGGVIEEQRAARKEERQKKKAKKVNKMGAAAEPWRHQVDGQLPAAWEVRKMTQEGNHVLRVGKAGGYYAQLKAQKQEDEERKWREGLDQRENHLAYLQRLFNSTGENEDAYAVMRYGGYKGLEKAIRLRRKDLIKYKDAMFGTSVWKEMTAHTVPHGLRHLSDYQKGDDKALYLKIQETRNLIFRQHRVTTASQQELMALMKFFGHHCMQWEMQMGLLKLHAVKALMYLGFVGGGHHLLRRANGQHPFGNERSAGGKRPKDPALAIEGCRMLMSASRKSPWILVRLVKLDALHHAVHLGLVFTRNATVLEDVLQLLTHFARLKGTPMGPRKLEVLKEGGLELLVKALRNHPLDFRVKRRACEAAEILVTGIGDWKSEARQMLRAVNITELAELGLNKLSHWVGSRHQARRALMDLYRKLYGEEAAMVYAPGFSKEPPRKLNKEEREKLKEQGRLPVNGVRHKDTKKEAQNMLKESENLRDAAANEEEMNEGKEGNDRRQGKRNKESVGKVGKTRKKERQVSGRSVREKNNSVRQKSNSVRQKSNNVGQKRNSVRQKNSSVGQKNNSVRQKNNSVGQKNYSARQKSNSVGQTNNSVRQKSNSVGQRNNSVRQKNNGGISKVRGPRKRGKDARGRDN